MPLRTVFFGTPRFAVPTLVEIVGRGHEVAGVYTQPPRAAGRGMAARKSAVHEAAERFGIPVFTPRSLKGEEEAERLAGLSPEVGVVVAYGLILPRAILDVPPEGFLNLHASLLPRWRGAAPVARAIMAGDRETGIMVMRMDEGLDTGPVAMEERVPIAADMTAGDLADQLAPLGADLMARALAALSRGSLDVVPQAATGATYARKIDKAETRIDWSTPASEVHNLIRGLSPAPGAWFEADLGRGPERIKVLRAGLDSGSGAPGTLLGDGEIACGSGSVRLVELQRAGRQPLAAPDFLRGVKTLPRAFA